MLANSLVQLLKLEWFSLNKDLRQAKNADLDGLVFESDIEEAARLREQEEAAAAAGSSAAAPWGTAGPGNPDADEMMLDTLEREQRAEVEEYEAMMASIHDGGSGRQQRSQQHEQKPPDSPHLSDDDDYDALFMDYLSQEQQGPGQASASSGEMDLS